MENVKSFAYSNHLVAFIDVLGFREMVTKMDSQKLSNYLRASEFTRIILPKKEDKVSQIKMITFSDSLIFFFDISMISKDKLAYATGTFFIAIAAVQRFFASKDIWIRGGISVGDLYHDESGNSVFGPAFIEAYDLESKYAKFPRVLISQKLVEFLSFKSTNEFIEKINSLSMGPVVFYWREGFSDSGLFRKDYPLFINYLEKYFSGDSKAALIEVIENLSASSQNSIPGAYEKYRWVADYLTVLNNLSNTHGPSIDEITADEISTKLRVL